MFDIKEIVKDNFAIFDHYRAGIMYYDVRYKGHIYMFPVPLDDIGEATLIKSHKAITLMRYIRKAIEEGMFIKKP